MCAWKQFVKYPGLEITKTCFRGNLLFVLCLVGMRKVIVEMIVAVWLWRKSILAGLSRKVGLWRGVTAGAMRRGSGAARQRTLSRQPGGGGGGLSRKCGLARRTTPAPRFATTHPFETSHIGSWWSNFACLVGSRVEVAYPDVILITDRQVTDRLIVYRISWDSGIFTSNFSLLPRKALLIFQVSGKLLFVKPWSHYSDNQSPTSDNHFFGWLLEVVSGRQNVCRWSPTSRRLAVRELHRQPLADLRQPLFWRWFSVVGKWLSMIADQSAIGCQNSLVGERYSLQHRKPN